MRKQVRPRFPQPTIARQRLWDVIRQFRRFTLDDVATAAECTIGYVASLMKQWAVYGIVRPDNDGWRLARDLGPLPPYGGPQAAAMFNRNTGAQIEKLPPEERKAQRKKQERPDVAERNRERRPGRRKAGKPLVVKTSRIWMNPERSIARAKAIASKEPAT